MYITHVDDIQAKSDLLKTTIQGISFRSLSWRRISNRTYFFHSRIQPLQKETGLSIRGGGTRYFYLPKLIFGRISTSVLTYLSPSSSLLSITIINTENKKN
jgi:hypothetical protein